MPARNTASRRKSSSSKPSSRPVFYRENRFDSSQTSSLSPSTAPEDKPTARKFQEHRDKIESFYKSQRKMGVDSLGEGHGLRGTPTAIGVSHKIRDTTTPLEDEKTDPLKDVLRSKGMLAGVLEKKVMSKVSQLKGYGERMEKIQGVYEEYRGRPGSEVQKSSVVVKSEEKIEKYWSPEAKKLYDEQTGKLAVEDKAKPEPSGDKFDRYRGLKRRSGKI